MTGPITVSGAIVAVKYDGGIVLASDRVITYGRSVKFGDVTHFVEITPSCVIGGSGEYADMQEIVDIMSGIVRDMQCRTGGRTPPPSEIFTYLKRFLYHKRTQMKPLFVKVVVAGVDDSGKSFLGVVDPYGTAWEDDAITTGIAVHMKGLQIDNAAGKSRDEVVQGIADVWRALKVRYVLAVGEVELLDVSATGVSALERLQIPSGFEICEGTWDQEEIVMQ